MTRFAPWFLLLTGLVFAAIAVMALLDPAEMLAPLGLQLTEVSSRNEMRAVYGGLNLAMALYLCAAFQIADLRHSALTFTALFTGGLVLGRFVSLVVDGMPNTLIWSFIAVEVTGCVLALSLRRSLTAA